MYEAVPVSGLTLIKHAANAAPLYGRGGARCRA
jgi:hypothetical protein